MDQLQPPLLAWTLTAGITTVNGKAVVPTRGSATYLTRGNTPPASAIIRCHSRDQLLFFCRDNWAGVQDCSASAWIKKGTRRPARARRGGG